jgi:hypothetical protein
MQLRQNGLKQASRLKYGFIHYLRVSGHFNFREVRFRRDRRGYQVRYSLFERQKDFER